MNTRDTITFQGTTVAEAAAAFRDSVDDYLEFCRELGEEPEKPFSGKFLVRIEPAIHRDLTQLAQMRGVSFNKLVTAELSRLARRGRGTRDAPASARADRPLPERAARRPR